MSENEDRFNHRNCADHDFAQNRLANGTFLAYSAGLMTVLSDIPTDRPVLIAGPTASGKSDLALELACRYGGVIINADALQVFANWRVLSARPSAEDEAAAPHQLYGHVPGDAEYSVGHWLREVAPFLKERARPIIVGGTGLYFRALTEGLVDIPSTPPEIRAAGDRMRLSSGLDTMLAQIDAATRASIDVQNPMRVQRAWEVQRATGRGLADWQANTPPPLLPLEQTTAIVLEADKEWLNRRIEQRFDKMLANGALDEARANLETWDPSALSSKAIGAPELMAYLKGEMTLADAREAATIATRQFAKRQRTWFRARMREWTPINPQSL